MTETEEKQYWFDAYGGMDKYLAMSVHSEIADFLALYYDVIGKRVIDFGGGPGVHCKYLQDRYLSDCVNLDKSQYAISFFQHEMESFLCDLESPTTISSVLQQRKFDLVISIQTLEHCKESTIQSIAFSMLDCLAFGGHCFLSVASPDNTTDKTHVTLKSLAWWYTQFLNVGFEHDFVRDKAASMSRLPSRLGWQCLYLRRP